jgi:hypothetical protein
MAFQRAGFNSERLLLIPACLWPFTISWPGFSRHFFHHAFLGKSRPSSCHREEKSSSLFLGDSPAVQNPSLGFSRKGAKPPRTVFHQSSDLFSFLVTGEHSSAVPAREDSVLCALASLREVLI